MTIKKLEEELECRRAEKQELVERCRTLEEKARRRRLIMKVLEQRTKNRKLKRQLVEKYKIHWSEDFSDDQFDEMGEMTLATRVTEFARPISPTNTVQPSTSAVKTKPEAQSSTTKRSTVTAQRKDRRKPQEKEGKETAPKKKRAPPKKKPTGKIV